MLKRVRPTTFESIGGCFAIVAAKYNGRYVDAMLRAAKNELRKAGATEVKVVRVPGSFEIPAVAARLAQARVPPFSASIWLGVIFQGETSHAQQVGWGVTHALAQTQLQHTIPVGHAISLYE